MEIKRFHCEKCGSCCSNPDLIITLDGDDLRRLENQFDLDDLMKFLTFYNIDSMRSELVERFILPPILTNKGFTYIGLNKDEEGKCIFLSESNTCEIYQHRPRVCRTFPFSFKVKEGWLYWGASPFAKKCPGVGKGKRIIKKELEMLGSNAMKQVAKYETFTKKWNTLVKQKQLVPYVYTLVKSLISGTIYLETP